MVTNLAYFYETSQKTRGGKWVWVKDSNGEQRGNVLLGGTILNPKKGFDHLYAAQLVQYTPAQGCLIFRSFGVKTATSATTDTTIYINGDGYANNSHTFKLNGSIFGSGNASSSFLTPSYRCGLLCTS